MATVSHSAFTRLLDRWWTNSFGDDICWTQMTWADDIIRLPMVFSHQNASWMLYLSANAGRLRYSVQISAKSRTPCCLGRETQCCQNLIQTGAVLLSCMCYF